jgi:hypothetical protein
LQILIDLLQWVFGGLALLWLFAIFGAFLTAFVSIAWLVLAPPANRTSSKSFIERWMKSYDDLGERLTSQRLAKPRKLLAISLSVFVYLLLFAAGIAVLGRISVHYASTMS